MAAKYIVIDTGISEQAVVFDETISHDVVAMSLTTKDRILSAGFVSFYPTKEGAVEARCYGKSQTLGIPSRPEDSELLSRRLDLDPYR